ncbi:M16 family metallopeptidase [Xanthobacter sp. TB0136]|uniref:M16 family metallopeptidase n=1 Tax=Xanthobacter sp. TB0136 TaxID=3459177 RepID=UPI00403A3989
MSAMRFLAPALPASERSRRTLLRTGALFCMMVTMALSPMTPARADDKTQPAPAASAANTSRITEVVSPGGIKAWLVHDTTLPLIAMEFAFRGGASQDGPGKAGLANLTASLLDEGAGEMNAAAFQQALADSAVDISFDASRDETRGSLRTLTENKDKAFDLLRLAVNDPRFDAEAVERIRAAIMAGLRRASTDPNSIASRRWFELAFPNHPYGQPGSGTLESVPALTRDDIVDFARRTMARDNLHVAVVGDITAEELGKRLDEVFGKLPEKAQLAPVADVKPQNLGRQDVVALDVPQSVVIIGTEGLSRNDPDFIPAFVIDHILGGSAFSSRLFKEVREERGLAYSVYSHLAPMDHAGLWFASTATKNESAGEATRLISDNFRRILAEGPTEEELKEARSYLTGSYALRFDTSSKVAGQLLQIQLDDLGIDYIDRRNALVDAVTGEDIKRAAARLSGAKDALVVIVGKPEGLEAQKQ